MDTFMILSSAEIWLLSLEKDGQFLPFILIITEHKECLKRSHKRAYFEFLHICWRTRGRPQAWHAVLLLCWCLHVDTSSVESDSKQDSLYNYTTPTLLQLLPP